MLSWIRQLFNSTPVAPIVKSKFTQLVLQRLEERETPATFNVTTTDDSGAGSLRDAVAQANANTGADTITFAAGLGTVILNSGKLSLTDTTGATTISGPSGGTQIVQRSTAGGTPNFRIFSINDGVTANLNYLEIKNGGGVSDGGGILNLGTLSVTNSTISANTVTSFGGGIYNAGTGTLTVTNSTISGNTSPDFGGGIYSVVGSILTVINSTISGNSSSTLGGGLFNSGGIARVTNSTISGNYANGSGGGILSSGTSTLTNVTITGNRSDNDNSGGETGGGLSVGGGTVTLNNTIIASNFRGNSTTLDDANGSVSTSSANNLIGDGTGLTGITNGSLGNQIGTAATPINPLLQPLTNNGGPTYTHALGQNSPALTAGSSSVPNFVPWDQRGTPRDNGAGIQANPDIGAYEVNHPLATVGAPTTLAGLYQPKPSATANEAFVKGLYQSTLLRAPDAAGLSGWLALLNGGTSRSTVANGFVNSTENRRNQVTFFYRYFLSREPDTAGLNGWVSILQAGRDEGEVMTGFILSTEFSGTNNNSQFVNLMYYALLSRQADSTGFNGWLNQLNSGMSRATVVNAFLRSEEGINRVVNSLFQTYLKRYASTGELGAFRTFLNTNTFGAAATLILSSAEFFTNAGNNLS